uniref:Uncharacterized protein n=1 Tax=Arundo donax TaxID=35708 RepID=A0A0A9QVI5_ARUDO
MQKDTITYIEVSKFRMRVFQTQQHISITPHTSDRKMVPFGGTVLLFQ